MNKYDYNNLTPFKWFVLENFPFIEADFDALTNWQLFCKLGKEMNKLIDTMNNLGQGMEDFSQDMINSFNEFTTNINLTVADYINQFNNLRNYVENYFDNLDVQEEINNKLDDMVEQGTLQEIITDYLNSKAIFCYDNVNEMTQATNLIDGSFARTLGYYNKNDGGGSLFYVRTKLNTDVEDNGSIIFIGDNLTAVLIVEKNTINAEQFGTQENTDSATKLQNAINFVRNKKYKLVLNKNYTISTLKTNLLDNIENCSIEGKGTIIIGANLGDYRSVLNLVGNNVTIKDITINENTTNNPLTENTGADSTGRIAIAGWNANPINNIIIDNIKINDCVGKWQITANFNEVQIKNSEINYSQTNTRPSYDRTSCYLNGENIKFINNILNGSDIANTGIECHGSNIFVLNNQVINYNGPIFPTNACDNNVETIKDIIVRGNIFDCKKGIQVWLNDTTNVDNIIIENNTINVNTDSFIFDLYPVLATSGQLNNLIFGNNICNQKVSTTKRAIQLMCTVDVANRTFTIDNIEFYNNIFKGYASSQCIRCEIQPTNSNLIVNNLLFLNNKFLFSEMAGSTFFSIVDTGYNFKHIDFISNLIKLNNISTDTLLLNACSLKDDTNKEKINYYNNTVVTSQKINLSNNNGPRGLNYVGYLDKDLKENVSIKNIWNGYVYDKLGQVLSVNENAVHRIVRNDTTIVQDANNPYTTGDIILKTDVTNSSPIGWLRTGGSWYPLPSVVTQ